MLSRRRFLTGALGATAAVLGTHAVAQSTRKRMICDAQVHLWRADSPDWPWVPNAKPQLPEPMTIERVLPLMDEAGVDRVIIVPPTLNDRNDYALEAAKRYPKRFAVMGRIPLKDPASAARIAKWKEPGMLGVRLTFNTPETIAWLSDGTADWFWPAAEKAGLPVMVLAFGRMPQIAPIAQKHPGLPIIIDHMGVNNIINKEGQMKEKIGETVALAKYPNVNVKLSNIAAASLEPYPFPDMKEPIRRVFDAFGPRRCHWGTDLTNAFTKANYRQRISHFTETLEFLSEDDKDWVMGRSIVERVKWA